MKRSVGRHFLCLLVAGSLVTGCNDWCLDDNCDTLCEGGDCYGYNACDMGNSNRNSCTPCDPGNSNTNVTDPRPDLLHT